MLRADGSRIAGLSSMSFSLSRLTRYVGPVAGVVAGVGAVGPRLEFCARGLVEAPSRDLERSRAACLAGMSGGAGLVFPSRVSGLSVGHLQSGLAYLQMLQ